MKQNYQAEMKISLLLSDLDTFLVLGGLQLDFILSSVGSLQKNHLHVIFLAQLAKSLLRSASFTNVGVGEKPSPFPN